MHRRLTRRWAYLLGAVVGSLLVIGHGAAIAQEADDEDDTFEQKIIKGILGGIGLDVGQGSGIDYSERAPLVIPPSNDLPPPQSAAAAPPDWPKEAHRKKPTSTKKLDANGSVRQYNVDRATASAAEMTSGPKPTGSGAPAAPGDPFDNTENGGRPLAPTALGGSTSPGLFNFNFLGNKPESARFVSEPPRVNLTQPPPGYQTPSPNYPYGMAQAQKGPSSLEMNQTKDRSASDASGAK